MGATHVRVSCSFYTHVWLRRCLGYQRKLGDRQILSPSLITLLTVALAVFFTFFFCWHTVVQSAAGTLNFLYKLCVFSHRPARTEPAAANDYLEFCFFLFSKFLEAKSFFFILFLRQASCSNWRKRFSQCKKTYESEFKHRIGRICTFLMNLYSLSFANKGLFLLPKFEWSQMFNNWNYFRLNVIIIPQRVS